MFDWLHVAENVGRDEETGEEAPRRQLLAGGGSLAATGLQMSLSQNRGAALSVEPGIDQVLAWFTAESSIDRAARAKLSDGSDWHRPVMDKTHAFTVPKPWFGCFSVGHVPEMHTQLAVILGFLVLSRLEESIALHRDVLIEVVIHEVLGSVCGTWHASDAWTPNGPVKKKRIAQPGREVGWLLTGCSQPLASRPYGRNGAPLGRPVHGCDALT